MSAYRLAPAPFIVIPYAVHQNYSILVSMQPLVVIRQPLFSFANIAH